MSEVVRILVNERTGETRIDTSEIDLFEGMFDEQNKTMS
jgi:hypothetical protein